MTYTLIYFIGFVVTFVAAFVIFYLYVIKDESLPVLRIAMCSMVSFFYAAFWFLTLSVSILIGIAFYIIYKIKEMEESK